MSMREFELEPGERVILEERKHWFIFLIELLPYAILAIIPFAAIELFSLAPQFNYITTTLIANPGLERLAVGIWLLLVWTSAWGVFTRYFLNAWILTDRRIVDITQHRFFKREVSSLLLPRVQDVTSEVEGFIHSLLGIGDIAVQSAGAVDEFHMYGISEPERMREAILDLVSDGKQDRPI